MQFKHTVLGPKYFNIKLKLLCLTLCYSINFWDLFGYMSANSFNHTTARRGVRLKVLLLLANCMQKISYLKFHIDPEPSN